VTDQTRVKEKIRTTDLIWSFSGMLFPALIALACLPIILKEYGDEKTSFLTIIWVLIGYFSFLDFGAGKALTILLSRKRAQKTDEQETINLIWSTVLPIFIFGALLAFLLIVFSNSVMSHIFNISGALVEEANLCILIISIQLPFFILSNALKGTLEAYEQFKTVNATKIPLAVATYFLPILFSSHQYNLLWAVICLAASRLCMLVIFSILVARLFPSRTCPAFSRSSLRSLFYIAYPLAISNTIGPLIFYVDRLIIAALDQLSNVAFYSIPFDAISKLLIIPEAIISIVFPKLAKSHAGNDHDRLAHHFRIASLLILILVLPILSSVPFIFESLIKIWIGAEFLEASRSVCWYLLIGIFINIVCQLPYVAIQATGKTKWMALLHLVTLPPYLYALCALVPTHGVTGAALVWCLRAAFETVIVFLMAGSIMAPKSLSVLYVIILFGGFEFMFASLRMDGATVIVVNLVLLTLVVGYVWKHVMNELEKDFFKKLFSPES